MRKLINFQKNEKCYQIDYKENFAVAFKMLEEIRMDLENDGELMADLALVDNMEQDVLHMIEFHNFNGAEGCNFSTMLKEIRNERRIIKDRLDERKKARTFMGNHYKPVIKAPLAQVVKNFEEHKDIQENRRYKIRALPMLEGFNKLINKKKISL